MIETLLYVPDTGFPVLAILAFCALTAVFAMALLARLLGDARLSTGLHGNYRGEPG